MEEDEGSDPELGLSLQLVAVHAGMDPGFIKRGFICIKVWGFALLILSYFIP